jgi:class 3 adenylate cyclase/tetratricopeptide (TPR) repeat protein
LGYKPTPVDTSGVALDREIAELDELLARNAHENWARLRMAEGWRYGPERNDARKEHPDLVSFEQLPECEKQHDRQTARETIKTLLALGYAIQPLAGKTVSSPRPFVAAENKPASALQLLGESGGDLKSLRRLWGAHDPEQWSSSSEIYALLAERILRMGEPLLAYDVAREGIEYDPKSLPLRRLLGLALARSGATASAQEVLRNLYEQGHRDEETVGLLARTHKDLARETADASEADQHLRQAFELYLQAYRTTDGYWSAINAATLALILGDREQSVALAREVRQRCRERLNQGTQTKSNRYWVLSTLGEAALLLGNWPEAEDWYSQAMEVERGNWGSLQSTHHNARLLVEHLGGDTARLEHIFRFPKVVVFAGHMIDRSDRGSPRFPFQIEQAVKKSLRQRLDKLNAGFGYASAACGSDILFHELIQERNGESHVVLPYEKELFVKDCVDIVRGADWVERFESVVAQAVEVQQVSKQCKAHSVAYEFANQILHGLASMRSEQLGTRLVPLAVWDGRPSDGLGGTAGTVQRWRKLGLNIETVDLREILLGEWPNLPTQVTTSTGTVSVPQKESSTGFSSEIRALLFADAEGFSKLSDEEIPGFVEHFLGLAGRLTAESAHKPLMKNTWGDGLYFVFSNVQDAGEFALELRDRVGGTDWRKMGLPALNLRIGLHAGPVHSCIDPVTERTNYIGAHVSRAARIEPITPTGQVYASQAFAALAAAQGVRGFRCDYVGQTSLAKNYGMFPTYVVLRRSSPEEKLLTPASSGSLGERTC